LAPLAFRHQLEAFGTDDAFPHQIDAGFSRACAFQRSTRRNPAAVTTHDPFTRDDSTLAGGRVPSKEEEWIVIPNVQLLPEVNPLTSAMIGSLVRHFLVPETTTRPIPTLGTAVVFLIAMATGRIAIHLWLPVVRAAGRVVGRQRSKPFWWMANGNWRLMSNKGGLHIAAELLPGHHAALSSFHKMKVKEFVLENTTASPGVVLKRLYECGGADIPLVGSRWSRSRSMLGT
jgi:hypothetical protein